MLLFQNHVSIQFDGCASVIQDSPGPPAHRDSPILVNGEKSRHRREIAEKSTLKARLGASTQCGLIPGGALLYLSAGAKNNSVSNQLAHDVRVGGNIG